MKVTIGEDDWDITFLATNQLTCRPPHKEPEEEDTGYAPGEIPRVTVRTNFSPFKVQFLVRMALRDTYVVS